MSEFNRIKDLFDYCERKIHGKELLGKIYRSRKDSCVRMKIDQFFKKYNIELSHFRHIALLYFINPLVVDVVVEKPEPNELCRISLMMRYNKSNTRLFYSVSSEIQDEFTELTKCLIYYLMFHMKDGLLCSHHCYASMSLLDLHHITNEYLREMGSYCVSIDRDFHYDSNIHDEILEEYGVTFDEFKRIHVLCSPQQRDHKYVKYGEVLKFIRLISCFKFLFVAEKL